MRLLGWWLLRQLTRNTPSLSRSAVIYVWVSQPWVLLTIHYWSCHVGKIHIYLILKIKTPFEKSSAINFLNQRLAENQNVTLKQKSIFLFNIRQNIKINENNTRTKTSEFCKWYSSNTVDIKLGRRYSYISENIVISLWRGSLFGERVKKSEGEGRERGKAWRQTFGTTVPRLPLCIRSWCKLLLARTVTVDRFNLHRLFGRHVARDLNKRL